MAAAAIGSSKDLTPRFDAEIDGYDDGALEVALGDRPGRGAAAASLCRGSCGPPRR